MRFDLDQVLSPASLDELLGESWGVATRLVKGSPERFAPWLSMARLQPVLERYESLQALPGHGTTRSDSIGPEQLEATLESGRTVCFPRLARHDPAFADLLRDVTERVWFLGRIDLRAYLSRGAVRTPLHFDTQLALVMQIEGTKHWRVDRAPAHDWPASNAVGGPDGVLEWVDPTAAPATPPAGPRDPMAVDLGPGDLLILPAGTWHEVRADSDCLAFNLAFRPQSFEAVLGTLLGNTVANSGPWRSGMPPLDLRANSDIAASAELRAYLAERFAEIGLLGESIASAHELDHLWRAMALYLRQQG